MTKKRFTKKDRRDPVIRVEQDLFKEVWFGSYPEEGHSNTHYRDLLVGTVEIFTDGEVSLEYEKDGVLLYSPDSHPQIRHKLVYPFKARTFFVSINWVQVTADLTKHVTYAIDEESVV